MAFLLACMNDVVACEAHSILCAR